MDVKKEPDCCRLCYTQVVEYVSIFGDTASALNIVDSLQQYFYDKVSDSDILPKVICYDCLDKVEAFHKFSEEVFALREQYLRQHLNNAVKVEDTAECASLNVEPEIHREIICVEPVQPTIVEREDEAIESAESIIHLEPLDKHEFSDNNECDDNDEFDYDDSSIFVDSNELPHGTDNNELPRHIDEVTPEQQQQVIDQYFDMKCIYCETILKSTDDATAHYAMNHINQPRGYVRCCQSKFTSRSIFKWHIVWHLNPEVFKCNVCGIIKRSYNNLAEHKAGHTTQYTCDICQKTFLLKNSMKRHMREIHVARSKFPCDQCDESFRMQKHLDTHVKMAHPKGLDGYEEDVRNIKINLSPEQIKSVMDAHFNMKCDFCDVVFDGIKTARPHYLSQHDVQFGYIKCCNIKLRHNQIVMDHIQWHINPDTFKCRLCKKETNGRPNLLKHIKSHQILQQKQFYCNLCEKNFERGYIYKAHVERVHKEIDLIEPEPEEDDLEISDYVDASCDLCSEKTFTSFNAVQSHYLDVHGTKDGYVKCCQKKFHRLHLIRDHMEWHRNPNIFRCDICNKSMTSRLTLSQHKVLHTKKFFCEECQRSFRDANNLRKHMRSHKGMRPRFICNICNKAYFTKRCFQIHYDTHNPNKNKSSESLSICEFCAKAFPTKQQLEKHLRKHSTEPPEPRPKFQCNICQAWYATKGILKTHQLMHTTGPQKCNQCGRMSANLNALKSHIRQVHCAPDFKCHLCDKICKSKDSLKSHIGTHLNEKHYKCTYCDETFIWRTNMYKHRKIHTAEWLADKAKKKAAQMKP
ncbi:zinc finger protein 665-like [Sitodiplosis mosellana]|uniref:zinc finger protein 665-like n=1 Tax=Sitodiplosis mosellana TaxID=263140 RepID=UPI0024442E82|nr:zinc finger protein 665-like [Sitodiplosis mosellana]